MIGGRSGGRAAAGQQRTLSLSGNAIAIPEQEPLPPPPPRPVIKPKTPVAVKKLVVAAPPAPQKTEPKGCTCGLQQLLLDSQKKETEMKNKVNVLLTTTNELKEELRLQMVASEEQAVLFAKLKKENDGYAAVLKDKEKEITRLKSAHADCSATFDDLRHRISHLSQQIDVAEKRHAGVIKEMEDKHKTEVQSLEVRLQRMKSQIADSLMGNSSERQKQIDELVKQFKQLQEEHESLKAKLRAYASKRSGSTDGCLNCDESATRVAALKRQLAERDDVIGQLKQMCEKFGIQLKQQDAVLTLVSEHHHVKVVRK